jgi:hypothetical protein
VGGGGFDGCESGVVDSFGGGAVGGVDLLWDCEEGLEG